MRFSGVGPCVTVSLVVRGSIWISSTAALVLGAMGKPVSDLAFARSRSIAVMAGVTADQYNK